MRECPEGRGFGRRMVAAEEGGDGGEMEDVHGAVDESSAGGDEVERLHDAVEALGPPVGVHPVALQDDDRVLHRLGRQVRVLREEM